MASKLNTNIRGYAVGEIPAKGATTAEITLAGLGVPIQALIDGQYIDSKTMSERPGMYLKYLPYKYDAVTGKLINGGSYLFDTWENAKDYLRWADEEFQVGDPKVKFWEQPMFESHKGLAWKVIGAHSFAPVEEHAIGRLQQDAAKSQGAASVWLLYNPDEKAVGLQLGFKKEGACDPESANKTLVMVEKISLAEQCLLPNLDLEPLSDRTSILLTLWLPQSRSAGGTELAIPYYPMVPDITHDHL